MTTGSSDRYVTAHIEDALATDPRTLEPGLEVRRIGDTIVVSGDVATDARRQAVVDVAVEHAGGLPVVNDTSVVPAAATAPAEHLP